LLLLRSGPELKISTTMRVLHIAGLAIIFAVVRSTTSTASGQRWANKPYETPGGNTRPPTMRPNVHARRLQKRDQFSNRDDVPKITFSPINHGNLVFGLPASFRFPNSLPESTETMTDDHPEHHHRPRPVITQKPGPISETPLMSSEADTEEHIMPPVMTEDDAMMPGKEFINAPESNEAMNEEMFEYKYIYVPEFKEVLHELIQDAVENIVNKSIEIEIENIVDKIILKSKIGHHGKAFGRDPQQISIGTIGGGGACTGTVINGR